MRLDFSLSPCIARNIKLDSCWHRKSVGSHNYPLQYFHNSGRTTTGLYACKWQTIALPLRNTRNILCICPAVFLKCFHNKMITITPMCTTHTHTHTHTHTRSGLSNGNLQYSLLPWRCAITVPCRASVPWLVSCSRWGSALEETDQKENENWLRVERAIWEKRMVSGGEGREDDRWTDSSRDGWMDERK